MAKGGGGRAFQEEGTAKANAQRRRARELKVLKASIGIWTQCVRLSEVSNQRRVFYLEDSSAIVGRSGHIKLVACSQVVAAVERGWKEGDIWEP